MSQVVINFKTSTKLKSEAKKVLSSMGLNFSVAMNEFLRKLINEKRMEFTAPEIPNARLRKAIKEAELEYKIGKMPGPFSSIKDLKKSLEV